LFKDGPHFLRCQQPLAQLGIEIAKRKPVWEKFRSAQERAM
jgi:hypothetical protein